MSIEIGTPKGNFGGYERNAEMLAPPDDELTKVGPGTPCGEYLRRYWMPVAMTQQITDLPLRIPKSNTDERQQISDVAHRVVDIYRAGDKYVGEERIAFMHKALKEYEANGPHT